MWDLIIDTAGASILELSTRAVGGGAIALLFLFLLAGLFKRNADVKQYCFVLIVIIILLVSGVLFATALVNMQETILTATNGVIS